VPPPPPPPPPPPLRPPVFVPAGMRDILDVGTNAVEGYTRTPFWRAHAIFAEVLAQTGGEKLDVLSIRRRHPLSDIRHYLMWRLRNGTNWSLPEIGRFIGGRDLDDCRKDFEPGMGLVTLSEDAEARSVTARFPLLSTQTATYRDGQGCQLQPWND